MTLNTLKTILGYFRALLQKKLLWRLKGESLDAIYNYLPISDLLSTSGQPSERQFLAVKDSGFGVVVNLAPDNADSAIHDEAGLLAGLGLKYVHLPVDFKKPTEEDFISFVQIMQRLQGEKVWLHCAANMRVSSFVFRYRCHILKEDSTLARRDLEKIWQPMGVWREFTFGSTQDSGSYP